MNKSEKIEERKNTLLILIFFFGLFILCTTTKVWGGMYISHAINVDHTDDNAENFTFDTMKNMLFLGATVGQNNQIAVGQSAMFWSKKNKSGSLGNDSDLSMLELGPRLLYFFDLEKTFGLSFAYHPYARGTRTLPATGENEKISGTAYLFTITYQLKITKSFYAGASFVYHLLNISESTVGSTESTVSQNYSSYYPVLDFSLRFK